MSENSYRACIAGTVEVDDPDKICPANVINTLLFDVYEKESVDPHSALRRARDGLPLPRQLGFPWGEIVRLVKWNHIFFGKSKDSQFVFVRRFDDWMRSMGEAMRKIAPRRRKRTFTKKAKTNPRTRPPPTTSFAKLRRWRKRKRRGWEMEIRVAGRKTMDVCNWG